MKYITKGEPNIGSLPYKVDLTDDVVTIPKREATTADYVLYDKVNQELVCVASSADLSNYPSDSYTPIGIVVIPASHDVYGDGSCGIMSLKEMDYRTPDEGSASYWIIRWGADVNTSIPDVGAIAIGNTADGIPTGGIINGYLPSDKFNNTQCIHDIDIFYDSSSALAPSPYLTDGSRNPGYYQTSSPAPSDNALADFDGIGNSQILWKLATAQNDWKTADTILNRSDNGYFPAACCCWRYHTEGTSQGNWYLPAMGELCYIMPPFNKINEVIDKICTAYGSSIGIRISSYEVYLSSSDYTSTYVRGITTTDG